MCSEVELCQGKGHFCQYYHWDRSALTFIRSVADEAALVILLFSTRCTSLLFEYSKYVSIGIYVLFTKYNTYGSYNVSVSRGYIYIYIYISIHLYITTVPI